MLLLCFVYGYTVAVRAVNNFHGNTAKKSRRPVKAEEAALIVARCINYSDGQTMPTVEFIQVFFDTRITFHRACRTNYLLLFAKLDL